MEIRVGEGKRRQTEWKRGTTYWFDAAERTHLGHFDAMEEHHDL